MSGQRIYSGRALAESELRSEIAGLWEELKTDSKLRRDAEATQVDLQAVLGMSPDEAFSVSTEGMGLDPATIKLVVSFAPLAAKILGDLWDHVFLPRIRRDKGADSLSPPPET